MVEYSFRRRKSKIAILVFKQDETFSNISDDVIQPVVSTYQITPGNDVGHDETKLRLWEITALGYVPRLTLLVVMSHSSPRLEVTLLFA